MHSSFHCSLAVGILMSAAPHTLGQAPAAAQQETDLEATVRALVTRMQQLENQLADAQAQARENEALREAVEQLQYRLALIEQRSAASSAVPLGSQNRPSEQQYGMLAERITILEDLRAEQDARRRPDEFDVFWKNGLRFETLDGSFKLRLGGRAQIDVAAFAPRGDIEQDAGDLDNGIEMRRARLRAQGTIYDNTHFKVQFDFADGEAAFKDVNIGLSKIPIIGNIRFGHFKEPFGLEEQNSSNYMPFMERSIMNEALVPSRNTGLMIFNTAFDERMTWAAGVFIDTDDFGDGEFNDGIHFTGRVTALPWYVDDGEKLLHLGVSYSYQDHKRDPVRYRTRPEAHLAPRFADTGDFMASDTNLVGAEASVVLGPLAFQAEYVHAFVDNVQREDPSYNGFYFLTSYFLTGEHRVYNKKNGAFDRVEPKKNFGQDDGIGAWEVAGRYSYLNLEEGGVRGGRLDDFTLGVNWYLNPNTRLMWNYGFADAENSGAAHSFQMRFMIDF